MEEPETLVHTIRVNLKEKHDESTVPINIDEYEKEIKPKFGEQFNSSKRQIHLDTCVIECPKNREKPNILNFIYVILDFIRMRFYKLKFKIDYGSQDIKFYVINHEHMKEFTLQNLIFRSVVFSNNDKTYPNSMGFSNANINSLFYFNGTTQYIPIYSNINDRFLVLCKDNRFWISKDFGNHWEKSEKKIFEIYKKTINKTEVEKNYLNNFRAILNLFKSEKDLYLIGFLNVVILCDKVTYDYIFRNYNYIWYL